MANVAERSVVSLNDFRAGDVTERLSKALNAFTSQLAGHAKGLSSKARTAAKSTDGFVRSSPWTAVGSMALAGIAVGILMSMGAQRQRRKSAPAYSTDEQSDGG